MMSLRCPFLRLLLAFSVIVWGGEGLTLGARIASEGLKLGVRTACEGLKLEARIESTYFEVHGWSRARRVDQAGNANASSSFRYG